MRSDDDIAADARDGRAFSNSTEWEIWRWNTCDGLGYPEQVCVHEDEDSGVFCPLITLSLTERIPSEWSGPHGRYRCSEKTTPAQQRATQERERQRLIADSHYEMFPGLGKK